jgi:2-polyprenyl-6-methoxyphenol hydroxylase-like FAD-dependent oxidoreductase
VKTLTTRCCIAGGGPAGIMAGLLLARAGIDVIVLEKHADFLRDFRGDTIHPSTLEVMGELGLLEEFLKRPHQELREIGAMILDQRVALADFSHLPGRAPFIALMPQWDFLDFLAGQAQRYPGFHLRMESEVTGLLEQGDRIVGAHVDSPGGQYEVRCDLIIGADGRGSTVREQAGLVVEDLGAPIDVLWMRLSRQPDDPSQALGYLAQGHFLVLLNRGDYWQCAFVVPKGGYDGVHRAGLEALRSQIMAVIPFLHDRVAELRSWDDIKVLEVRIDRLAAWARPGLLCVGDAAHAMSPIGGVGINLAIQDAVAAANLLAPWLRRGAPPIEVLRRVQRRRELPTRLTQRLQILIQNRLIRPTLAGRAPSIPIVARMLNRWPRLRRLPARLVGLGFLPEHVGAALQP